MSALLGVLWILLSAWCIGALLVPRGWFERGDERAAVRFATGLAALSNAVFILGYLRLLYPLVLHLLLFCPVAV